MSPLDVSRAQELDSSAEFERLLLEHGADARDVIVAVYKKASGKQVVTFDELLEVALCHGWVDTQTKASTPSAMRSGSCPDVRARPGRRETARLPGG